MVERVLSSEPDEGGLCRICKAQLPPGSPRCSNCGAVHGEAFRCPHCRAVADVESLADGRLRCRACGGPRLLISEGAITLSGRERESLRLARRALLGSGLWKTLGAGLGAFGAFALLAAIAVVAFTSPGVLLGSLALVLSSLPLLFGFGAYRRGVALGRERDQAWRAAELSAAKDLAEATPGELTARVLGKALGVDEARAELLLAELSLDDHVARRVTDTGELAYSAKPRVRIDGGEPEPLETAVETEAEAVAPPAAAHATKEGS
jgi:hypothetical protein